MQKKRRSCFFVVSAGLVSFTAFPLSMGSDVKWSQRPSQRRRAKERPRIYKLGRCFSSPAHPTHGKLHFLQQPSHRNTYTEILWPSGARRARYQSTSLHRQSFFSRNHALIRTKSDYLITNNLANRRPHTCMLSKVQKFGVLKVHKKNTMECWSWSSRSTRAPHKHGAHLVIIVFSNKGNFNTKLRALRTNQSCINKTTPICNTLYQTNLPSSCNHPYQEHTTHYVSTVFGGKATISFVHNLLSKSFLQINLIKCPIWFF
jgi:hypothetical protein